MESVFGNYIVLSNTSPSKEEIAIAECMLKEQAVKEFKVVEGTMIFENKLAKLMDDGNLYSKNYPAGELVTVVIMKCRGVVEDGR